MTYTASCRSRSESGRRRLRRGELVGLDGALLGDATQATRSSCSELPRKGKRRRMGGQLGKPREGGARFEVLAGGPGHRRGAPTFGSQCVFERTQHLAPGSTGPERIGVGREGPFGEQAASHEPDPADVARCERNIQ